MSPHARCHVAPCDDCLLEEEHDASERPDALDPMEADREAHRVALATILSRTGRSAEEIRSAIDKTRKPARAA